MSIIQDGTGSGNRVRVSGNRMFAHTVTQTEAAHAASESDAYNINTGTIGLTTSTASGILYLKNNEANDIVIEALAVGVGSAGTTTDVSTITLVRNPTGGTLISGATAVDMNQNRNFGTSKTLTADAYKGAEGSTVTGGNNIAQFYLGAGGRLFAGIDFVLTRGDSVAVTIDTNTTSGTTNVYAAFVCFLQDQEYKDL